MNLSPLPVQKFFNNLGLPMVGGKLFTYAAGTMAKIDTYQNQGGTPNTNPIILNFRGEANVWLDPLLTYKFVLAGPFDTDPPTNPIWSVDNISALGGLTQQILGQILYPRSPAEIAASVTPVNYFHPWGYIERYGTNTVPGTTDMTAALVAANAQSLQAGGAVITAQSVCHIASATTISGRFAAPATQVFTATSAVTFGPGAIDEVIAEWFGCKGDGTYNNFSAGTDNLAPFNKAVAALPAALTGGGVVRFGAISTYRFSGAPTLRSDLAIVGVPNGIPFNRTPILQAAGSGIFLDLNFERVSVIGVQIFGNNVAGAKGVRVADQHNCLENLVISQFDDGAGTPGLELAPAVGKQTLYLRGKNIWVNSCGNGVSVGDGSGTVNANTIVNLILSGNSRNGLLVNKCNVLNIFGLDAEGNVTGGTGANINIVAGTNINITGYSEITTETGTKKNIILPAGSANANNIRLDVYADGNVGNNFFNEDVFTYVMTNPRQVGNNEPVRFTNLSVNALSAYDPGQNVVAPVLQAKNGPVCLGAVTNGTGASWPALNQRNSGALANAATLDLSAFLRGARTAIEGLLLVHSDQDNAAALFYLKNNTTVEYLDPANKFSITSGTASSTNIYFTAGHYELQNNSGASRNYSLQMFLA